MSETITRCEIITRSFPRLTGRRAATRLGTLAEDCPPIVIDSGVLDQILNLSDRDPGIEVGGFLLGNFCRDPEDDLSFIEITHFVEATQAAHRFSSLTFTHESWSRLHQQLASRFPTCQVVGWHHTHPGFGIFLSRQDEFIHRHFFARPWQVALVVDPRRGELGFFQWQQDRIVDTGVVIKPATTPNGGTAN